MNTSPYMKIKISNDQVVYILRITFGIGNWPARADSINAAKGTTL